MLRDESGVLVHPAADGVDGSHPIVRILAFVCLVWYCGLTPASLIGYTQLWRWFTSPRPKSKTSSSPNPPHITIIRPVKGIEPYLYDCLAATFHQDYDRAHLSINFCVSDPSDPAVPILEQLLRDFPDFGARILLEPEDEHIKASDLGPNPKIRNMSRAYREAKGDLVWIIDCNVWVARGTLGRMVDTLQGNTGRPAKFVHLLPLVVDVTNDVDNPEARPLVVDGRDSRQASPAAKPREFFDVLQYGGGRLEEMFMSSSHAKFYTGINTVLLAPCIVGKSTMFRRSHLNSLTDGKGIDFFSENICEDHLIGDLLWRRKVTEEQSGEKWNKHAMVFGDLAIQPMAAMSVRDYIARRVRWLRVRKFTVAVATLVEPGTESFLCSLYGAFGLTTLGFLRPTWTAFWLFWLCSVAVWCGIDRTQYQLLHSGRSIAQDENTPVFARPPRVGTRRPLGPWLAAWLAREALAFPVWAWAVFGGVTVTWRGKDFWVGLDMKVHEIVHERKGRRD